MNFPRGNAADKDTDWFEKSETQEATAGGWPATTGVLLSIGVDEDDFVSSNLERARFYARLDYEFVRV